MSIPLKINHQLGATAQYVKDQAGNSSSLSLTKKGNVGIGTTSPKRTLDVDGTISIKSSVLGEGIYFVNTEFHWEMMSIGSDSNEILSGQSACVFLRYCSAILIKKENSSLTTLMATPMMIINCVLVCSKTDGQRCMLRRGTLQMDFGYRI